MDTTTHDSDVEGHREVLDRLLVADHLADASGLPDRARRLGILVAAHVFRRHVPGARFIVVAATASGNLSVAGLCTSLIGGRTVRIADLGTGDDVASACACLERLRAIPPRYATGSHLIDLPAVVNDLAAYAPHSRPMSENSQPPTLEVLRGPGEDVEDENSPEAVAVGNLRSAETDTGPASTTLDGQLQQLREDLAAKPRRTFPPGTILRFVTVDRVSVHRKEKYRPHHTHIAMFSAGTWRLLYSGGQLGLGGARGSRISSSSRPSCPATTWWASRSRPAGARCCEPAGRGRVDAQEE